MAKKILILFAHPLYEKSRVNRSLLRNFVRHDNITVNDLYEVYPDFNIDINREKNLLLENEIIIWHHPFYWYSCPPMLKQWIDMVLEVGWAYGPGGTALKGKSLLQIITTGGPATAYQREGNNKYTIREFLIPFQQTVRLCHMNYLPPFIIQGTHRLSMEEIRDFSFQYNKLFDFLSDDSFDPASVQGIDYINDAIVKHSGV